MMRSALFFGALLPVASALAQSAPSDSLFNTDQVITIDLTFADPDFWSTLTTQYTNDLGETLTADVTITDNTGTHTYPQVEVDLKGNSSYGHPGNKKSFKIDFNDNISGQKYHGMTKVHLNNGFKDPTFLREKLFLDFSREQGILAPRVLYANVYMNGTFWGFYDLVEAVDKNFLDRWVDDNDGNLFKAGDAFGVGGQNVSADLGWYGSDQAAYYDRYELKTNETANDWSDLLDLLDLLNNSSDADLQAQLPSRWVWEPMLRSLAVDNMFSNLDSYINSARNYYLYHDSSTFLWNWVKWDANESFGRYGGMGLGDLQQLSPDYLAQNRPLMTRILGLPAFRDAYHLQYCLALASFTNAHLDPRIDQLADLIRDHVYADANKQYTNAQFEENIEGDITVNGGMGGPQTIYGLKSFIFARKAHLTGALDCSTVGLHDLNDPWSVQAFPNPTSGHVSMILPSGAMLEGVILRDALGRSLPLRRDGTELDLDALAPGAYFLDVRTDRGSAVLRVWKDR